GLGEPVGVGLYPTAGKDRLRRKPPADEGLVHAVSRERVDQPGGVADEKDAAVDRPPRRAPHRQPVAAQVVHHGLVDPNCAAELSQPFSETRPLALPAADADVDVVALPT